MSDEIVFFATCLFLLGVRTWTLRNLLALPSLRGPGWFFDAPPGSAHVDPADLRRRYRRALLSAAAVVEILALSDAAWYLGELSHLIVIQAPLTLLGTVVRSLTVRFFMLRTRQLAAPPDARLAFSLKRRRLADYSNPTFEWPNAALALAALLVIVGGRSVALTDWERQMISLLALVVVYVEVGCVLWKRAMLGRQIVLPADHTDEHLRLVEDALRLGVTPLDGGRALLTLMLALLALKAARPDALVAIAPLIPILVLLAAASFLWSQHKRGQDLLARHHRLGAPVVMRSGGVRDPENLRAGGLVYCNADSPAVFVAAGPIGFAVNVLNKATYLYVASWVGLAVLLAKMAEAM